MSTSIKAPDLTKRPPRSPRVRLGGLVILPRMLDKGRATLAGTVGDYHFDCPLDGQVKSFLDFDAEELKARLAAGAGDGEALEWILANSKNKRTSAEIAAWSRHTEQTAPGNLKLRGFIQETHEQIAPDRTDIHTLFDLLDLDDHVSYGGIA
jgi:hypothetical protein